MCRGKHCFVHLCSTHLTELPLLRMSSAASLTGGKYTRDLKLRVLEHYFRNGGDVFGNKQSTAKKFGVDSKTINRFLKIPELVRAARKNAKSSKSGSSSGFKVRTSTPLGQSIIVTNFDSA